MNIIKGVKEPKGVRFIIYGVEGIGKTTLASKFPKPLFLDFEKGSNGLAVDRIDCTKERFASIRATLDSFTRDHMGYRTLVIDSVERFEQKIIDDYLEEKNTKSLVGYGKFGDGWIETSERFCACLDKISEICESGMNVVLIGHAEMRRVELPEQTDAYDHWELALAKRTAPKAKQWTDVLAFINYKLDVIPSSRDFGRVVNKPDGGKRMVYTTHTPFYDAKHRAGFALPDAFLLDDAAKILCSILPKDSTPVQKTTLVPDPTAFPPPENASMLPEYIVQLRYVLSHYGIEDEELKEYIRNKGLCGNNPVWEVDAIPEKIAMWLIRGMEQISKKMKGA